MQTASRVGPNMVHDEESDADWSTYLMRSAKPDNNRFVEANGVAEDRPAKRLQKDLSNTSLPPRSLEPTPSAGIRPDPFPSPASRRRLPSSRDQRALPTTVNLPYSPSKRSIGLPNPQTAQPVFPPRESDARQASASQSSRTSLAVANQNGVRKTPSSEQYDLLPAVNFDDFHSSIKSVMPAVKSFPTPDETAYGMMGPASGSALPTYRPALNGPSKTVDSSEVAPRTGLNGAFVRRHNSLSQRNGQWVPDTTTMNGANGSTSIRPRRKSYFPVAASNITSNQAPRKSVGPGILADIGKTAHPQRRPSLAQAGLGESALAIEIPNKTASSDNSSKAAGNPDSTRHGKTKSLQPPPRKIFIHDPFSTPVGSPTTASPMNTSRSPGRPTLNRTITPSSSKRLSMMPSSAHATGLAARTISPTDVRRLKRMSMMPNPPSVPYAPPLLPPNLPVATEHPTPPSPSLILRKSVTPSSSRTTPEPNRKSYSSGISNSSATSYNSALAPAGSLRISQSLSTSRLPTLKTRGDNVPTGDDETVPPVPAIPKAYESPKGELDQPPFPAARKSSLGLDINNLHDAPAAAHLASPVDNETFEGGRHDYKVTIPTTGAFLLTERTSNNASNPNRRTLQPLRLPPLNLLPLGTPTTSKIAALSQGAAVKVRDSGAVTPPPNPGLKAAPATPMTASKANFSRNYYDDDHAPMPAQIRSSSSHYNMRTETLPYRATSSSSNTVSDNVGGHAVVPSRVAVSPFVSSSLPRSSEEFGYGLTKSNTFDSGMESKSAKLTGPRAQQKTRKVLRDDTSSMDTTSSVDASTPSLGTTIRRKLSLTRKRSASKAQTAAETDAEIPPNPPRYDDMPPPKLPASATWSGPFLPSPSPTQKVNQPRAPRHRFNSNTSTPLSIVETPRKASKPSENGVVAESKRTARAALEATPGHNALSLDLKGFLREAKNLDSLLDRDDLSAEEEMRKLATKRKETDSAAKELDSLRRRATAKDSVSHNSALRTAHLNIFEKGEIVDYKEIYFCGTHDAKKHVGVLDGDVANFGYDDDRGDYNIVPGDHLAYQYEIVDILGKGSFGQVVRCIDHKAGGLVAIKIIRNKKRFHQQALVEVDILQKLRDWDPQSKHSMVNFTQSFYFRGHLCISTELLGMNLYEFIKCHEFRGFSLKLIRRFAKQLLSSLVLLKSHKVIHCDLKPENVLLAHPARSEIKVIDFGSSCLENEKVYTYIQSRFYRSPEVILGMTYGMPIDMWSLGCILAELLTGYPIFPGENEQEQLACIMEVFGPPEKHLIEKSTRKKLFFDSLGKPRITVSTKGKRRRPSSKSLQQALKCEDEPFLDFITRCLRWDPGRRLKPDDAIHHEFITGKPVKSNARPSTTISTTTSSPIKRYNSLSQTQASARPLPEPPATSFKNGTAVRNREVSHTGIINNQSPSKSAATLAAGPKRHSTMTALHTNGTPVGMKKTVNSIAVPGSGLPRVTSSSRGLGNGKSVDLAAAAAQASLKTR